MSLAELLPDNRFIETFKDNFGAYSTIIWSEDGEIDSWVQHFTNPEATNYHRNAAAIYSSPSKGRAS